ALVAACAAAPALRAGRVLRVGPTQAHATIQLAVDAALDGDLILVDPGSYPPFVVDGKALAILGATAGLPFVVQPDPRGPAVQVRNLPVGRSVTIEGLTTSVVTGADSALRVDACLGPVRIARCT